MRIAACYKNVPDNEKIKLAPDNSLDLSAAAPQIGQYDLNAVEAAVEIAAGQPGTEIIALTVAGDVIDNTKQRKAILSRGADRMVGVKGEFENADTFEIASAIAAAVEKLGFADKMTHISTGGGASLGPVEELTFPFHSQVTLHYIITARGVCQTF